MIETLPKNGLVLYKNSPAKINQPGDKLEIELDTGKTINVRPKDVTLLHPGPVSSLANLQPPPGDAATAWELLAGQTTTLPELAGLIFDDFTPATTWATWQLINDGLYFRGAPDAVQVRLPHEVEKTQADRATKETEKQARAEFLARVQAGQFLAVDRPYMADVEALAYGRQDKSWVLRELNQTQSRENAHALLLNLGCWDYTVNPYPQRLGVTAVLPNLPLPPLPNEPRLDLTHLPAFAIDDAGSADPDDAISLDGRRLWVHVADVAALAAPDSPVDLEARARGASLYLPEGTVTMLPPEATKLLGLGLAEVSPALSFGLEFDAAGEVTLAQVAPSWVRVDRLSYEEAETRLEIAPFDRLLELSRRFTRRREANGAVELNLPEVKIRVNAGVVAIKPLPRLNSRDMVRDAMLMAGEAVARFARENNIPLLFSTQEAAEDEGTFSNTVAGMFARRRTLKRSQLRSLPAPHAGLGLTIYAQTTSPLRRYADLVIHQQLRAYLQGRPLLTEADMLERVGAAEAITSSVRQTERLANKHWTLVYLQQNPGWSGAGILVEDFGRKGRLLLPDLDLETQLQLPQDLPLNSHLPLVFKEASLPFLEAYFRLAE